MPMSRLSGMSIADLRMEIQRRLSQLPKLIAQRDALNEEIAQLQSLAKEEPKPARKAAPKPRVRRRGKNRISLAEALAQFMAGKAKVTVAEAMEGVIASGYKTKSKAFRGVVNQMLLKDERFKSVGRGQFTLAK